MSIETEEPAAAMEYLLKLGDRNSLVICNLIHEQDARLRKLQEAVAAMEKECFALGEENKRIQQEAVAHMDQFKAENEGLRLRLKNESSNRR
jgi:hypothetical protein